jgi:hypothetical protein
LPIKRLGQDSETVSNGDRWMARSNGQGCDQAQYEQMYSTVVQYFVVSETKGLYDDGLDG